MSAVGFTPIQLYRSTTASAVPTSGNLADGELAINTNDGKLYYKDSGGAVQLIASKAGASGDVVGPASATDNAVVRFDGTTGKLVQNSVVTIADTTGDIAGAGSITSTSASGILTRAAATQDGVELIGRAGGSSSYKVTLTPATLGGNRTLTLPDTTGTVALTGSTVASFSAGSTGFTPNSATTGAVTLGGTLATTNGGTGLTSFTANQVFYASSTSAVAQSSNLLYSGTDLTVYGITVGRGVGALPSNTVVGANALSSSNTGTSLVAVGESALLSNTSGANSTAVGRYALYANITGGSNTASGFQALFSNTTASNNTAVGYQAGDVITTGARNTIIGDGSDPSANNGNDQTVVGQGLTGKGNDTAFIGGTNGAYNEKNVTTWETTSDERIKKNIVDNTVGLEKIKQIRIRNFEYRKPEEITELPDHAAINKDGVQLGVIAQEIQQVLPECVTENSTGVLSVSTDPLVWHLINAVKQLSAEVESLKSQLKGN